LPVGKLEQSKSMTKLITATYIKRLQSGDNMVSKDQGIGGLIFLVCVIIAIGYTIGLFWFGNPFGGTLGGGTKDWTQGGPAWPISIWLIAVPVYLAFILILGIGAWIGWTMATTPPPKPIEEIEAEEQKEE